MSLLIIVFLSTLTVLNYAQQPYINNKQLNCTNNSPFTQGFYCTTPNNNNNNNNNNKSSSCLSYATFRTTSVYDTPTAVARLLATSASQISLLNNISSLSTPLRPDTLLVVPLPNCSCISPPKVSKVIVSDPESSFYQHAASYRIKTSSETYFTIANLTFEGLSTCQALVAQNPIDPLNLLVGDNISVPIRCACPSRNQTKLGFRYLLSYIVTWGDSVEAIADMFGADEKSIWDANELIEGNIIFPFTPLLVPLRSEPVIKGSLVPSPDPSSPNVPSVAVGNKKGDGSSRKRLLFIGLGIGFAILFVLALFVFCLFRKKRKINKPEALVIPPEGNFKNSWSVSSETVKFAIGSLTVYEFEELEKATGFFDRRIKGSVYRASFKGDEAAVKVVRGDVSEEINILKQINHSNIIRLSGICVHDGNTYLVYEYAFNGSLDDWLFPKEASEEYDKFCVLGWKQRVQIAYDVADALNYLHNYTNPLYVHKNLKSSNILLDGEFRAKVSNFGLARTLLENEDMQMTRHVVGTHGYMAPEYIENGLITPKIDVFSFGVILLEILSGKMASAKGEEVLSVKICEVLRGENVREKLKEFVDPCLGSEYPFDLVFSFAQLSEKCVDNDLNSRPSMAEVFMTLSKILSSSMDWDPSEELDDNSRSLSRGR